MLTLEFKPACFIWFGLHRKEVIQPHLPIRLTITGSHGVTGGVYKARERIHRGMLIRDY
jgi:hypothetical protein